MSQVQNSKEDFWKISTLGLIGVLILSLLVNIALIKNYSPEENSGSIQVPLEASTAEIKRVSAEEIYLLFFCPCCGQPLDKNNICCGLAKERIDYIDDLVEIETSEDDVILAYVKKYGLNSFLDEQKQEEFRQKLVEEAPADRPVISLSPESYDFEDVSQKEGKVYTYFELKNEGKNDLVIEGLETSCGCTFVSILFEGEESPFFTMPGHGYENPEWEGVSVPAGAKAQLKVMYDPAVHQDFRGYAIREIYVYSSDPIDFEKKVSIELNQVD